MPRYFFNLIDDNPVPDEDGTELPDLTAARHAAIDMLAEQLRGSQERLWGVKQWRLEITDPTGRVLVAVSTSVEDVGKRGVSQH